MIAQLTTAIRLVDDMPLPALCYRAAPCPSMDKTPVETRLWKRWTINFAHLTKRGNIMKAVLALFLLAGSLLSAQTPARTELQTQYDTLQYQIQHAPNLAEMERLMKLQEPIAAELTAQDEAQLRANTQAFAALGRQFLAADADLRIALAQQRREQKRYRREPWHREFWRRKW
jgi:hypothetical protein